MAIELLVIGGGSMGGAIVQGAVRSGNLAPSAVGVVEPNGERCSAMICQGVRAAGQIAEVGALAWDAVVLIAVKPQVFPQVAPAIRAVVDGSAKGRLVMSVMAGVTTAKMAEALGPKARVIRAMPNLPALVGRGMTALSAGQGAGEADEARASALFKTVGQVLLLDDEEKMDAFTGVAGSGPAYVFLLTEAMAAAGEAVGLTADEAAWAARQTMIGAARLMEEDERSAAALREAVTSPGGTTAAALNALEERGFREIVSAAVKAARDRGCQLGQQMGK